MTKNTPNQPFSFYKEHPKSCAPNDFWGQVKRTVNGQPVSDAQIKIIIDAVGSGLELNKDDFLLDLCCGNGALSRFFFNECKGGLGVDFSAALIGIAKNNFEVLPHQKYILEDVVRFSECPVLPTRFTKILCYGSFAYLEKNAAQNLLKNCLTNFSNVQVFYIGNCPDKSQATDFFRKGVHLPGIENEPDSAIGIWRTKDEFSTMAQEAGWSAQFITMPDEFYASKYRYDVILTRVG